MAGYGAARYASKLDDRVAETEMLICLRLRKEPVGIGEDSQGGRKEVVVVGLGLVREA